MPVRDLAIGFFTGAFVGTGILLLHHVWRRLVSIVLSTCSTDTETAKWPFDDPNSATAREIDLAQQHLGCLQGTTCANGMGWIAGTVHVPERSAAFVFALHQ
ncbi:hypothetical protein K469DRAFT_690455 [Zopfia rhizophila CBS 207.26]|uniref:Uncharacterized protein n=1 Tax=Zopfia rhizophila CBS 207.26 TaxID=1314779 RepID=A0A6A6DVA6_9PEZI|nr:hypothetical protein K469DRAFT_690455 [Zopfia rhizophila CBS 207.26]